MRHLSRHLQATVQDHIKAHLSELGWLGPDVPFGALPVQYQTVRPSESLLVSLKPNLVSVSFGGQSDDSEEQLGGGLIAQEHVVFVDIYAENEGVALALSEDVRDLLVGRASYGTRNPSRFVVLSDYTTVPPTLVPGYRGEFIEVRRDPSQRDLSSVVWHVVSGSVLLHTPGTT